MKNIIFIGLICMTVMGFGLSYLFASFSPLSEGNTYPEFVLDEMDKKFGGYKEVNEKKDFKLKGTQKIELSTLNADIVIIRTHGNIIKAHLKGKFRTPRGYDRQDPLIGLKFNRTPSSLSISTLEKKSRGWFNKTRLSLSISKKRNTAKILKIYLPASYKSHVRITTTSGDVTFFKDTNPANWKISELEIKTVSGDIRLNTTPEAKKCQIKTVSGDLKGNLFTETFRFKSVSGDVRLNAFKGYGLFQTVSGDVKLALSKPQDLSFKTVSGDVRLRLPKNSHFSYQFNTTSGDLRNSFGKNSKSGKVGTDPGPMIEMKSVSGDLTIRKNK